MKLISERITVTAKELIPDLTAATPDFNWEDYAVGRVSVQTEHFFPLLDFLTRSQDTPQRVEELFNQGCVPTQLYLWCNVFYDECEIVGIWDVPPDVYTRVYLALE